MSSNNSAQQSPSSTSTTTTTTTAATSLIKQAKEKKETKENVDITQQRQQKQANASTTTSGTAVTSGAGAATPTNINQNSVNTILKKLGVNANVNSGVSGGASTGGTQSSPLSNLISSIGSGQSTHHKSVNNSVVNVNLNVLKDINIDEMIDDDDDEERKFLIKELEKKAIGKGVGLVNVGGGRMSSAVKQEMLQQQQNGSNYNSESENANVSNSNTNVSALSLSGARKRSRSNSSTLQSLLNTSPTPASTIGSIQKSSVVLAQQQEHLLSQLNITLNCHYCWAQFQLNVTKNFKSSSTTQPHLNPLHQQKENGKYMQHLSLHLNAPYKCNECSYPITDAKTFLKHKQFYKHDEKTCIMVDNDIQQTWV